ncbi:MAG: orotate phosphoribosyltransferase [Bacteroidia bacterium]|nr:orotate phosphoribosyltransferase [Bacteroidia bacterium]
MERDTAKLIADHLLQIKAVKLQPNEPYTWASGWKSPIYCDNRITLSYPRIRTFIRQELAKLIENKFGRPDLIAGVATAAIAQGALVAEALGLPFCYVRPKSKEHGLKNQIEGEVSPNQSCVVIEDLISTGSSSLQAVELLKAEGVVVKGMVSIFTYGFNIAEQNFKNANCVFYSLCNYDILIKQAQLSGQVKESDLRTLMAWRQNPAEWGK